MNWRVKHPVTCSFFFRVRTKFGMRTTRFRGASSPAPWRAPRCCPSTGGCPRPSSIASSSARQCRASVAGSFSRRTWPRRASLCRASATSSTPAWRASLDTARAPRCSASPSKQSARRARISVRADAAEPATALPFASIAKRISPSAQSSPIPRFCARISRRSFCRRRLWASRTSPIFRLFSRPTRRVCVTVSTCCANSVPSWHRLTGCPNSPRWDGTLRNSPSNLDSHGWSSSLVGCVWSARCSRSLRVSLCRTRASDR